MKKYAIGILTLVFFFTSCSNKVVADFEITNNTDFVIDSLKIEPMVITDGKYISLKPNEKTEYRADMTGIAKIDGSYRITFKQNGKLNVKDFGYYTNGYPTEKLTRIEIENDTINFEMEFGNY